jgi:hypothetical protein
VSDAHQVTAGVTTRLIDAASGAEALRLGVVQRYLLRDQRVTPDGVPLTQRFSDILLLGGAHLSAALDLDAALQYSPDIQRTVRSMPRRATRPGEFRTSAATYRLTRGLTEQLELGWQWPVYRGTPPVPAGASGGLRRHAGMRGPGQLQHARQPHHRFAARLRVRRRLLDPARGGRARVHRPQRGDHPAAAAARAGGPVAAGIEPAAGS